VIFTMVVVENTLCSILIAVWAVAGCFFLWTLLAQVRNLSIFSGLLPFKHLFDKLFTAMNACVFDKLSAVFAFGWFFKAHDLEKERFETESLLAPSEAAFVNNWFALHIIMACVAG
jgi:hypothetical protein